MSSKKVIQKFTRKQECWFFGLKVMVICGFLSCMRVSSVAGEDTVCLSNACSLTASTIRRNMNLDVKPCTDFYEFACGGFLKSATIPSTETSVNYADTLRNEVRENLTRTIAAEIKPNEPKYVKLAKKLYKSCMNPVCSGAQGLQALKVFLSKLGGWPVLDGRAWNESTFDWRQMIYKSRSSFEYVDWVLGDGIGHLIDCRIEYDLIHQERIITLYQPKGLLWRGVKEDDFNKPNSFLRKHYNFLVNLAVELGADKDRASSELRETLSFEIELANIKLADDGSTAYKPIIIYQLNQKYPSVPWMEYIKKFVPSNITITNHEVINVKVPEYYVKLEDLMSRTSKRVQANYVFSRIAIRNAVYSSNELRRKVFDYLSLRRGIPLGWNQTKWCTDQIITNFNLGISGIYEKNYFNEVAKNYVSEMATKIKLEAHEKLLQSNWMDNITKAAGLKKLDVLAHAIGSPQKLLQDKELDKFYENLEFDENNFFDNMDSLSIFDLSSYFRSLRKSTREIDWETTISSAAVNAFYGPMENSIGVFAGMLHGLYFDQNRPNYLNYGAIGTAIGHEITHVIYLNGRYFDQDGYQEWWQPPTVMNFWNRSECITKQYENYVDDDTGIHLNGALTLAENIADIGGFKLAYDAYQKWVAQNAPEQKLPGFEKYSVRQMFWISRASVECAKYDKQTLKADIKTTDHTLNKFRINGPLSNMPEFAKDFHCQKGSQMNPETKCIVW